MATQGRRPAPKKVVKAAKAQPRRQQRPGALKPPQDATGRKAQQLAQEHAEAVAAREGQLGMVTAAARSIQHDDVIDVDDDGSMRLESTGELVDGRAPEGAIGTLPEPPSQEELDAGEKVWGVTGADVTEIEPEAAQVLGQPDGVVITDQEVLNRRVLVIAEYDQEDITLGKDNLLTIRRDYKYRMPMWMAIHLEEKGLVRALSA